MSHPATDRNARMAWWQPLLLAVGLGALAGIVQVCAILARRHLFNEFTWTSRDVVWMSPVGNVAILLAPALVLVVLVLLRSGWVSWGTSVGATTMVAAVSTLLNVRGLHPWAVVVLALGIAVQAGRNARAHPDRWRRWTPRLAAGSVAIVLAMAAIGGRRPVPARTGVAPEGAPNVLVLILDTVRAASTSLHGYARSTTPALERLAAEGVRFDWAIAPSSWTLPSHGAMFTGRAASTLSTSWRTPLDRAHPTLAEALAQRGYATGAFVGNLFYTHHESGIERGFQVLHDFRRSRLQVLFSTTLGQTPFIDRILWGERTPRAWFGALRAFDLRARAEPQSDRRRAAEIVDEFLAWQQGETRPFLAFLNLYDAHDPYDPPPGYRATFAPAPTKQDNYDAGIRYMDDQMDRMLRVLGERGVLGRTLVVVTSDHGEQWGEHGLVNHGNSLYLPAVHVPLVMRLPAGARAGQRVVTPVSLTDLAATVLTVAGVTDAGIPGRSLLEAAPSPAVTETEALDKTARVKAPAERGALASIVRDSLQYIRNGDSTYQLFNVLRDYAQEANLVSVPAFCHEAVLLDSLLRLTSREPRTPPFGTDRCATGAGAGR